jgi:hypothetical protein
MGLLVEDVEDGMEFAMRLAHGRAHQVGRYLHPIEARWVIRAGFRARYIGLDVSLADQYADRMINAIQLCQ